MPWPTKTFDEQFWPKVEFDPFGGCWLWAGVVKANGYGNIWDSARRTIGQAHRVSYETFKGPIPDGFQIDHRCRVRCCVNPDHLEAVTPLVNVSRSLEATGKRKVCPRGHEYTESSTGFQVGINGYRCRYCKKCRSDYYIERKKKCLLLAHTDAPTAS